MKLIIKLFVYTAIFSVLLVTGYILIFSLDAMLGGIVWVSFIVLTFSIFCLSIFGFVMGHLNFMKLRNRIEVTGLMISSIILGLIISVILFINVALDYGVKEENFTLEEKTRYMTSMFLQTPSQKNMFNEKKNGITYYYSKETEKYVVKLDTYLQEEKETFDDVFGVEDLDPFIIEIHNDSNILDANFLLPKDLGGYYNFINKSIHLLLNEDYLESVLLHEYTHYRIHQFSQKHDLPLNRLPQWFQEGTGEYFGNKKSYDINLDNFKAVDFHLLDNNNTYHETTGELFNPYEQSVLAVNALVDNHGVEIIPELMMSKSIDEFYFNLEKITGKSLSKFQQTLVSDLQSTQQEIINQLRLVNIAIEAQKYQEAQDSLNIIKEIGNEYDIELANNLSVQIYLKQGFYEEAIEFIEVIITKEDYGFKTNNLLALSESYLVIGDTEKALETIKKTKKNLAHITLSHQYQGEINSALEAYELINSSNPLPGYKMLIEEELIATEEIRSDLIEHLRSIYPNEF